MQENLPLKLVHYSNYYGTFIAFSSTPTSEPRLCSCSESAVCNYLRLRQKSSLRNTDPLRMAPLDSFNFPDSLAKASLEKQVDPMSWLCFESKICHRCQLATPSLKYCHPMYGGEFKQSFGWYINQSIFRSGVDRSLRTCLPDVCPSDTKKLINKLQNDTEARNQLAEDLLTSPSKDSQNQLQCLQNVLPKLQRKIWNIFENETRREFGVRNIGEAWVSENILFNIVMRLFPDRECLRHLRPSWLEGLELDIFIPEEKIAFEYQGQQHFHPIKHWGGQGALDLLRKRDARKVKLCRRQGVLLFPIDFTEPLTEQHIQGRIESEILK